MDVGGGGLGNEGDGGVGDGADQAAAEVVVGDQGVVVVAKAAVSSRGAAGGRVNVAPWIESSVPTPG